VSLGEAHDQVLAGLAAPRKAAEGLAHFDVTAREQRRPELGDGPADRCRVFFQELEEKERHVLEFPVRV
jgi:hypothetical protein